MSQYEDEFQFGLETEYILARKEDFHPLWYQDLEFKKLNSLLETVSLEGIPKLDGLDLESPHSKVMPYVVEGYHLPDMDFKAIDILPKGIEIRTPICRSISEVLEVHKTLFNRLQYELSKFDLTTVALSHHPIYTHFRGPQNKRRHDYWLWSMEVMTTYGPDINIGISDEMMKGLDILDFNAKINHYAAAMTVFSLSSPFHERKLWEIRGRLGKSLRTYRRSIIAPPIEIHPNEQNRLEFKVFDMSSNLEDYGVFFLLFLTLLLDPELKGRASNASRIYDQGAVAVTGWDTPFIESRAQELLKSAERTLHKWGFEVTGLEEFETRLRHRKTPADELIERYFDSHSDLKEVLRFLSEIH